MDYRRKRWCHFVGIATKWLCKFNPYQANHVHSTKDGGRGKLSCKYDSTPVTSTWWYQSCSKVHISPLEDYGCPEKAMSTVRPACVPPALLPCGISCRRKATPARSSGPEAVGASTPLMWQPQDTERRALALRLHHVIGRDLRLVGQGAVSLDTLSENAQIQIMEAGLVATLQSWFQHALYPTFHWDNKGPLLSNLHRLAV